MTNSELVFVAAALVASAAVVLIPRRTPGRAAGVVVGTLALVAGALVAAVGAAFVSPPGLAAGGILLGGGFVSSALATRRPALVAAAAVVAAGTAAFFVERAPAAGPPPTAAGLAAAIGERAAVRDDGAVKGLVWGARDAGDLRAFAAGLAATDVDFGIALGRQERPAVFGVLLERIGLPAVCAPAGEPGALDAVELARDGVAVIRPVPHLVIVVAAPPEAAVREAVAGVLASVGEPKRHLVLAMSESIDAMPDDAREWWREQVREHHVDLVLSSTSGPASARRDGDTTFASVGPGPDGSETLLHLDLDARSLSLTAVERDVGPDVACPIAADALDVVAAGRGVRRVLPALPVAAVAVIPLLLLGLCFRRREDRLPAPRPARAEEAREEVGSP